MHRDVASGFNLEIEPFLHLNCMEKEKVTLRYLVRFSIQWLAFNEICETYKRMLRHWSALKKKRNLSFIQKKNSNCAGITKIDEKIQNFN